MPPKSDKVLKVLVIRKPDATIHVVELANKSHLMGYNKKLKADQRWTIEEMDREKAELLPHIDPNFVSPAKAVEKLANMENVLSKKDQEIEDLKQQLAKLSGGSAGGSTSTGKKVYAKTVAVLVAEIKQAKNADEVLALVDDDEDRKGVTDAAAKQIESFK